MSAFLSSWQESKRFPLSCLQLTALLIAEGNEIGLCKACSKSSRFPRRNFSGLPLPARAAEAILLLAESSALPVLLPAHLCWLQLTWPAVLCCGAEVAHPAPAQLSAGMRIHTCWVPSCSGTKHWG